VWTGLNMRSHMFVCLFVCLLNFLTLSLPSLYFLPYLLTSMRIYFLTYLLPE